MASQKEFNEKAKKAFRKIRDDMENIKASSEEWIIYLRQNQEELMQKISILEQELSDIKSDIKSEKSGKKSIRI